MCFRWINLLGFKNSNWNRSSLSKIISIEHRNNPVQRGCYLNPYTGDLVYDFSQDIFKCQYWEYRVERQLMAERNELMESYCDFVVKNWNDFETGNYQKTTGRPRVHYQEPLTEEIIAMNVPDLTKDEELLARVD